MYPERQIQKYANGFTHVHYFVPFLKNFGISLGSKVGASYEKDPSLWGMAHFLEHLLVSNSSKFANSNELDKELAKRGIFSNAFTSFDVTSYVFTAPVIQAEFAVDTIFDIFGELLIDDDSVKKEQGIITEEINMYKSDDIVTAYFKMLENILRGTTYAHEILGTVESINAFTVDQIKEFYEKYYSPSNSFLYTYGGIEMGEVSRHIPQVYLDRPTSDIPERDTVFDRNEALVHELNFSTPGNTLFLGRRAPVLESLGEVVARLIFIEHLSGGKASLFEQELKTKSGIVSDISISASMYAHVAGYEVVYAKGDVADFDEIAKRVRDIYEKAGKAMTADAFNRARNYLYGQYLSSIESSSFLQRSISDGLDLPEGFNLQFGTEHTLSEVIEMIEGMTFEQYQELVSRSIDQATPEFIELRALGKSERSTK